MSFRARLYLFFVVIVVLPMIAIGVLVAHLTSSSRSAKADAALASGLKTALALNGEDIADNSQALRSVVSDPRLTTVLRNGVRGPAQDLVTQLAKRAHLRYMRLDDASGKPLAVVGNAKDLMALAAVHLTSPGGAAAGSLIGTDLPASQFIARVRRVTADRAALADGDRLIGSSLPEGGFDLPAGGEKADADANDTSLRLAAADLPQSGGLRVVLARQVDSGGFLSSRPLIVAALVAFFLIALVFAVLAQGAMRRQLAAMLAAAQRIGQGDFSGRVPVIGRDEFAGLASEFNKMSDRLEAQIAQLRSQRMELDRSLQRLGTAISAGMDRDEIIDIVVETSVSACAARGGRAAISDGTILTSGEPPSVDEVEAIRAAERGARKGGVVAAHEKGFALAAPMARHGSGEALGVISVYRTTEPFNSDETDVLLYLAGQVSTSLANIEVQEEVAEQAVTDELTGLANRRAFDDWMDGEAARALRFGHDLSLLMIDLDDFKLVNDTFGHPQGDVVLKTLGAILQSESRGIDQAGRYGGEEFAIALPETDAVGAHEVAERIRVRVANAAIALADGKPLTVTSSIGVATMPLNGTSVKELVNAADDALYEAKRSGKNRVVSAKGLSVA